MTDGDGAGDHEETFALVANEVRLDVLRTLWDAYTDAAEPEPEPLTFSTLRERVGVRDSGRFHYHLDELVPQLVTRTDDGYAITYAGAAVVGAAHSGAYGGGDESFETAAADPCAACGGSQTLRYDGGRVVVECDDCGASRRTTAPPVVAAAHDAVANPELLGRYTAMQLRQTLRGFCHLCGGPVEGSVADEALSGATDPETPVRLEYACEECGAPTHVDATTAVLDHPAVVALLHDAGIDYREVPSWAVRTRVDAEERVVSEDPVRVEVTVRAEGEVTLLLDDTLDVVDCERG